MGIGAKTRLVADASRVIDGLNRDLKVTTDSRVRADLFRAIRVEVQRIQTATR